MKLTVNNQTVNVPSSLSEITLGQRIAFQQEHGDLLDEMLKSITEMEDGPEKELELTTYQFERMFRTMAFFIGCTVEALKECEFLDTIVNTYSISAQLLFEQEKSIECNQEYEFVWNKELWHLHTPELKNGDRMTFGEFIDSKQIIQDMIGLGKNRWECLLPLCAIYLRRVDEVYEEAFLYDDSQRLKLMENLPLDIALQVGFFLSSSLNLFRTLFQSSHPQGLKIRESMSKNTLSTLAG